VKRHTGDMQLPTTVAGAIQEMHRIDGALEPSDGVHVFNAVYLRVTERIGRLLEEGLAFDDGPGMADLDTRFAGLWLAAYDAAASGRHVAKAWAPLFSSRRLGLLPIQFALAGMNTHIEHDLALAVVRSCEARGTTPDHPTVLADFLRINEVLADTEAEIRRSFLDELGQALDDELGPVAHLVSSWSIEKARDVALLHARTIWELRRTPLLRDAYLSGLGHTVGMGSRLLLTPVAAQRM
jgi:hypothetical protein